MLDFDENFFKEEVKYGFLITEKMKRIRAADLEVLDAIDKACIRNGINWFADFGTLLGAVRHQGFIPWDDDVDICMKRVDYNRFFSLPDSEFPPGFVRRSHIQDRFHNMPMGAVMNTENISFEKEHLERYHGCPYIIGTDVFPLDDIPDDEGLQDALISMYNAFYDAAFRFDEIEANEGIGAYLPALSEIGRVQFDTSGDIRGQLWEMTNRVAQLFAGEECENAAYLHDVITHGEKRVFRKKSLYEKTIRIPFENINIPVPAGFDEVLKIRFGERYMIAQRQNAAHDYPFYRAQDELIKEMTRKE